MSGDKQFFRQKWTRYLGELRPIHDIHIYWIPPSPSPSPTPTLTPGICYEYTAYKISTFLSQSQIDWTDCNGIPQSQILESPPSSYPEQITFCGKEGTLSYDNAQISVVNNGTCIPVSPSSTPTLTPTPSVTNTNTPTPSITPSITPSQTATQTLTPTPTTTCFNNLINRSFYDITCDSVTFSGNTICCAGSLNRGVVYSTTNTNPTIPTGTQFSGTPGCGNFTLVITGLSQTTTYYIRPYISGSFGTNYYQTYTATTLVCPSVTPTNTSSSTPTLTPTQTLTPTCGTFTTQYMSGELQGSSQVAFKLFNNPDLTGNANAVCDYNLSGTYDEDGGPINVSWTDIFNSGNHTDNYNFGVQVSGFTLTSVIPTCPCVNVIYVPNITPTPSPSVSPTQTPSPSVTNTPSISPTQTPSITPSPSETSDLVITGFPTETPTNTPTNTPSITPTNTPSTAILCYTWTNNSGVSAYYDYTDCNGTQEFNKEILNGNSICAQDGTVNYISGGVLSGGVNQCQS